GSLGFLAISWPVGPNPAGRFGHVVSGTGTLSRAAPLIRWPVGPITNVNQIDCLAASSGTQGAALGWVIQGPFGAKEIRQSPKQRQQKSPAAN
ncbi:MAG TPA: hypothetical protein VGH32_14175, partial [Pirellulales bacterium]